MTTLTKLGARTAAVAAGITLFASIMPALANAGACTFYRDLTVGVTGADVVCLQTYLISSGFSIPAGPTGYFGTQTQAATAAWQAAHGVYPPAGYFGPISRAEYNVLTSGTSSGGGGGGGTGAATLTDFNLISEDNSVKENETGDEIARAQFNVNGGDVDLSRMDLEFRAQSTSESVHPWDYIRTINIYDGSDRIGSATVSDESDWDENGGTDSRPTYLVSLSLHDTIRGGTHPSLSIQVNTLNSIDNDNNGQTFTVDVPDQGIHATDSKNNQLRTGDDSDTVDMDVNGGNGGADANDTSNTAVVTGNGQYSYGTFTFHFTVTANDSDIFIPETISNDGNSDDGVIYDPDMGTDTSGANINDVLNSTADTDSNYFVVREGDTESFTAQVIIDPASANYYEVGLTKINFATRTGGPINTLHIDENDSRWHTDQLYIPN
jgi:peptidoglycan hydrolase-like protein with peptidoglycan-binding domain